MKKIIPMIAMMALFTTTMMAASDVHAQTGNDIVNNKVSKCNPEAQTGTGGFHCMSLISMNKDIV